MPAASTGDADPLPVPDLGRKVSVTDLPHTSIGLGRIIANEPCLASCNEADRLIRLLAGRWTLAVLTELASGGRRYQELHDAIEGISAKVLTDTLRRAERDGLIARHLDADRVETTTLYELTDLARSLDEPLGTFDRWVRTNWQRVELARRRWDHRATSS
jgi:DNA-binding HxlR family transcriptional regulator